MTALSILYRSKQWRTQDAVHGFIVLPGVARFVIDHPVFQRMREIKQLGVANYVYAGALHNRFTHSIGTAYLAMEVLKQLDQVQVGIDAVAIPCKFDFTVQDLVCCLVAALCHDLGHPAFSHMFEQFVRTRYPDWDHEIASNLLVEQLWADVRPNIEKSLPGVVFTSRDLDFIKEMIDPPKGKMIASLERGTLMQDWNDKIGITGRDCRYSFMYEIVSNWRGGLDVDRLDYFMRDAFYLSFNFPFNTKKYIDDLRLMRCHSKSDNCVADENCGNPATTNEASPAPHLWTIASSRKGKSELEWAVFDYRIQIYQRAYRHAAVCKVELHYVRAMLKLNEDTDILNFARLDDNFNYRNYMLLDDSYVMAAIKQNPKARSYYDFCVSRRNLMLQLIEIPVPISAVIDKNMFVQELSDSVKDLDVDLQELKDGIIVLEDKFHRGNKHEDPCKWLMFHDSKGANAAKLGRDIPSEYSAHAQDNMKKQVSIYFDPPLEPKDDGSGELQYKYSPDFKALLLNRLYAAADRIRSNAYASDGCGVGGPTADTSGTTAETNGSSQGGKRKLERKVTPINVPDLDRQLFSPYSASPGKKWRCES